MDVILLNGTKLGEVNDTLITNRNKVAYEVKSGFLNPDYYIFLPEDIVGAKDELLINNFVEKDKWQEKAGRVAASDFENKKVIDYQGKDLGDVDAVGNDEEGNAILVINTGLTSPNIYVPVKDAELGEDRVLVKKIPKQEPYQTYFQKLGLGSTYIKYRERLERGISEAAATTKGGLSKTAQSISEQAQKGEGLGGDLEKVRERISESAVEMGERPTEGMRKAPRRREIPRALPQGPEITPENISLLAFDLERRVDRLETRLTEMELRDRIDNLEDRFMPSERPRASGTMGRSRLPRGA